jgi:hypothetical protein
MSRKGDFARIPLYPAMLHKRKVVIISQGQPVDFICPWKISSYQHNMSGNGDFARIPPYPEMLYKRNGVMIVQGQFVYFLCPLKTSSYQLKTVEIKNAKMLEGPAMLLKTKGVIGYMEGRSGDLDESKQDIG